MSQINTISEFLIQAGTDYRIFDMARGIRPIPSQDFLEIENASKPAPYPRQQHAWFGILFFNKQLSKESYIWFVKLPLDEQGRVISATRQQFLQIVVDALGQSLDKKNNPNNQLPENPFTFVPNQQQLANFNSKCRIALAAPLSEHLCLAEQYITQPEKHDWQLVPMQGVADFCAKLASAESQALLVQQFPHLAVEMQHAICASLENHIIDQELSLLLINWYQQNPKDQACLQSVLRGLAQSQAKDQVIALLNTILAEPSQDTMLMLIAARHWQYLGEPALLEKFIQLLAQQDFAIFAGLFSDLVQIPAIRPAMLGVLRWPNKSPELTQAIGQLFGQTSQ